MAIEFDCPNCQQLVKTPDAAAGKKGRCPSCKSVIQIPAASTSAASRKPATSDASTKDLPIEADSPFEFACPSCGSTMRATGAAVGKKGRCATCKNVVVIPSPPPAAETAQARQEIDEDSLIARFHEEEETPAPTSTTSNKPGYGTASQPSPQAANPWAAWGQASKPATPLHNPFLSALDDASKSAPETKLNPYATAAMAKAAEKGVEYNWDDDLRNRIGLPYERDSHVESPFGETFNAVLFSPGDAFRRMYVDRGVDRAVQFCVKATLTASLLLGTFAGFLAAIIIAIGFSQMNSAATDKPEFWIGAVLGFVCGMIGVILIYFVIYSVMTAVYVLVSSCVQHAVLAVSGSAQRSFLATMKVSLYCAGVTIPIFVIPCIGFFAPLIFAIISGYGLYAVHRRSGLASAFATLPVLILSYVLMIGAVIVQMQNQARFQQPPDFFKLPQKQMTMSDVGQR